MAKRRETRGSVIISGILNNLANKAALFRTVGSGYVLRSVFKISFFYF